MKHPYVELTNIVMEIKRISRQLESIWNKVDTLTCETTDESFQMQHLPCDSCEEKEDDNSLD